MKRLFRALLCFAVLLTGGNAYAQRAFNQAELDALLAPIALYPDPLLGHVLNAAVFPQDTLAAAAWSRANSHLQPDDALRAADGQPWHPSVKALVAYPDVLARIAESPQWLHDLGQAYSGSYEYVNATVQQLRARAAASGHLQTNDYQRVYSENQVIYVQPVYPQVVYAPYYNPLVVYGAWWWPHYRPVYWRPWVHRPVVVTHVIHKHHGHGHGHIAHRPHVVHHHRPTGLVKHVQPHHTPHSTGLVKHVQPQHTPRQMPVPRAVESRPYRAVPEAQRAPIIQGPIRKEAPVTNNNHRGNGHAYGHSNSHRGNGNWNSNRGNSHSNGNRGNGGGRHRS